MGRFTDSLQRAIDSGAEMDDTELLIEGRRVDAACKALEFSDEDSIMMIHINNIARIGGVFELDDDERQEYLDLLRVLEIEMGLGEEVEVQKQAEMQMRNMLRLFTDETYRDHMLGLYYAQVLPAMSPD